MIAFADTILRGCSLAALTLFALRAATSRPLGVREAVALALCLCMAAYVLVSAPSLPELPAPASRLIEILPVANPVLLWLMGLAIFDDRFRLRAWHALPVLLTIAPALLEPLRPFRGPAVIALYLHLGWIAYATARDDLVDARIAFRRAFFALIALTGLAVTYVELTNPSPSDGLALAQAAVIAALSSGFLYWTHQFAPGLWPEAPTRTPKPADNDPLLMKLNDAMNSEIWRTEGLTIGALAAKIGAPEHRLRALINRELGHRNFASFINAARVDAACAALSDPAQLEKQILTIAYESGFASLGPFNRAFRARTGVSPTEWRDAARRN